MRWKDRLHEALDKAEPGELEVTRGDARARLDVTEVGPIGVRLGGVRVTRGTDRSVTDEAERLTRDLRSLPDRVGAVEVDPTLGGARLRTRPDELRDREFFEVDVHGGRDVEVRKVRLDDDGGRHGASWDVTRDQLGRLLEELEG